MFICKRTLSTSHEVFSWYVDMHLVWRGRATISVRGRTRTGMIWFTKTTPFRQAGGSVPTTHVNTQHRVSSS